MEISFFGKIRFGDALKSKASKVAFWHFPKTSNLAFSLPLYSLERKVVFMRKKNYKGSKGFKTSSCKSVRECVELMMQFNMPMQIYCRKQVEEVKSFQVNVLLQGLEEGHIHLILL